MFQATLTRQFAELGLQPGDTVLVHASFKSVGIRDPETILQSLTDVLWERGTLLMPALTYLQVPPDVHDARTTPTCVGYLTEYFRTRPGTIRSLHPTHSVCAIGHQAERLLADHHKDNTPCGRFSPFNRVMEAGGKVLMLGCGLSPNTTLHAIEEYVAPPYLFGPEVEYALTDMAGNTVRKRYVTHGFKGYVQRYERVAALLNDSEMRIGMVGNAKCHLLDARALFARAVNRMRESPLYFVDKKEG